MSMPHPALFDLAAGRNLRPVDDFEELVGSAHEHRMTGLLWTRVQAGELALPEQWQVELLHQDMAHWERHGRLWVVLKRIGRILDALDVPWAAFKGVAVERRYYDRIGERPCTDLDLFLGPGAWERAGSVIEAIQPGHHLTSHAERLIREGRLQAVTLIRDGTYVDLHIDPLKLGIRCLQAELFWKRTVHITMPGGGMLRTLDPETSLIVALLHLARDRFRYLLGYADVSRMMGADLDWGYVERVTEREGIQAPISVALDAVKSTLGLQAGSIRVDGWRVELWKRLWKPSIRLHGELGRYERGRRGQWLVPLTSPGRTGEAIRWWIKSLFPPAAVLEKRHPSLPGPYPWRRMVGWFRSAARRRAALTRLRGRPSGSTDAEGGVR